MCNIITANQRIGTSRQTEPFFARVLCVLRRRLFLLLHPFIVYIQFSSFPPCRNTYNGMKSAALGRENIEKCAHTHEHATQIKAATRSFAFLLRCFYPCVLF